MEYRIGLNPLASSTSAFQTPAATHAGVARFRSRWRTVRQTDRRVGPASRRGRPACATVARACKGRFPRRTDNLLGPYPFRGTAVVNDTRLRCDSWPAPKGVRTKAQVRLLAIHEEKRVETAQRLPETALDEEETSRDDIDLAFGVASPAAIGLGVEEPAFGEQSGQSGGSAKQAP